MYVFQRIYIYVYVYKDEDLILYIVKYVSAFRNIVSDYYYYSINH